MKLKITCPNLSAAWIAALYVFSPIPALLVLWLLGVPLYWDKVWIWPATALVVCLLAKLGEHWSQYPDPVEASWEKHCAEFTMASIRFEMHTDRERIVRTFTGPAAQAWWHAQHDNIMGRRSVYPGRGQYAEERTPL